jgi:PB1 domain
MVVVDRQASLADLHAKLSRTLLGGRPFSLKYQLPNEDLDSLISVSTDEDLENMIDEYDRIVTAGSTGSGNGLTGGGSSRTSRIRLFLFPAKHDSASSMGSMLDDSTKSETWFVDALNSAMGMGTIDGIPRGMSADSTSVNCLLGLEDDSSTHSRPTATAVVTGGPGDQKLARPDVQSVPDSPLLDKSSSFGSTSSAPSLSNLPPIRVRPDDRPMDHRMQGNIDEHFAHMGLSGSSAQPESVQQAQIQFQPHHPPVIPAANATPGATSAFSPSENPSRVISDDEKSDHSVGTHRAQQSKPVEAPHSDPPSRYMIVMLHDSDYKDLDFVFCVKYY